VQTIIELPAHVLQLLLDHYGIKIVSVTESETIPGSFWGDSEAGLIENRLYLRPDTPVHSALHEACHYICMDKARRQGLHTDAGGDYDEENAVCYLQIILAAKLQDCGADNLMKDMDSWGYTFRLGSARAWFEDDAEDARDWLISHKIIDDNNEPTWNLCN